MHRIQLWILRFAGPQVSQAIACPGMSPVCPWQWPPWVGWDIKNPGSVLPELLAGRPCCHLHLWQTWEEPERPRHTSCQEQQGGSHVPILSPLSLTFVPLHQTSPLVSVPTTDQSFSNFGRWAGTTTPRVLLSQEEVWDGNSAEEWDGTEVMWDVSL